VYVPGFAGRWSARPCKGGEQIPSTAHLLQSRLHTRQLLAIVDQTTEPTQVSLWLRPSAPGSSAHPTVRHGRLPGPTEAVIRTSGCCQPDCSSVEAPQTGTTATSQRSVPAPAITLEPMPLALLSTRNRLRTAVRRGASWTAAYRRQLTVAAVARPVRGGVGAPGVPAAERSWWLLAQTASAQRSVQPVSGGRALSPWSTRPAGTPRRRSPLSSRRCPPIRSWRPGSGCPAVRCPVTWGRRPEGPAVGRLLSSCPVSSCPVSIRAVSSRLGLPSSVRTRPSPHSGGGGGDQVEVAGRP
jgi:hypothetical protein